MGRVVLRAIEVKVDNKWQILPLATFKKTRYSNKADDYIESDKIGNMYQDYIEEASLYFRDYVFDSGIYNNMKKPVPSDACETIKDIISEYSTYCLTLSDWAEYAKTLEEKFKKDVAELYYRKHFKKVNDKLDCLLNNEKYQEPTEEDIDDEREELNYFEDEVWHENFNLIIAVNNEYNFINDLLYAIYETWPDCRIYYFID